MFWVDRGDWNTVEERAQEYCRSLNEPAFVLNEGASVPEAMDGAISLAYDLIRNEQELGFSFQHIFIDAGVLAGNSRNFRTINYRHDNY